jgi:hypothetical protein
LVLIERRTTAVDDTTATRDRTIRHALAVEDAGNERGKATVY